MAKTTHIAVIGCGAREHALVKALARSPQSINIFCLASQTNPGIKLLSTAYQLGNITDPKVVVEFAKQHQIDIVIIGPEAPLEQGVADVLWQQHIAVIGPKQSLARIETSKQFARDLLSKYHIPGSPDYQSFSNIDGVDGFLQKWPQATVIKADGLMGGKGVKVFGEHFHSDDEARQHCQQLIDQGKHFILEQKLQGVEFSLISFSDSKHLVHTPAIQDHKRAFVNDQGPNTGGMGSYSDSNHRLPFLSQQDIEAAQQMNQAVIDALHQETGQAYIGFLYGGFMATADGVKLIEYNARLGDPEAINLLGLLESDFASICQAMVNNNLNSEMVNFSAQASVCKYTVPDGYPDQPVKNEQLNIDAVEQPDRLFFAAVDQRQDGLYQTGSRAIAVLAIADNIEQAEQQAEKTVQQIKGSLFHRPDIGSCALINQRIALMNQLRGTSGHHKQ